MNSKFDARLVLARIRNHDYAENMSHRARAEAMLAEAAPRQHQGSSTNSVLRLASEDDECLVTNNV